MDLNGGIGLNGTLPWSIPKDLQHYGAVSRFIQPERRYVENSFLQTNCIGPNIKSNVNLFQNQHQQKKKININIMGRKTYYSIPDKHKPLKDRINLVITSKARELKNDPVKNLFYVKDFTEMERFCQDFSDGTLSKDLNVHNYEFNEAFVTGGVTICEEFCRNESLKDQVKTLYLTFIHSEVKCDVFWKVPEYFQTVSISKTEVHKGLVYDFRVFVNKNLLGKVNIDELVVYDSLTRHAPHEEYQYLNHIQDIIKSGKEKTDRTGTGTFSKFGLTMKFDCSMTFPLLTTKDTYWKGIVEELLWFVKGCTSNKALQEKKVKIWDGNSTREYLDSIGLSEREEGDLGPVYGFQWRHSGADYTTMHEDYTGKGVDQLGEVISTIMKNPDSRRIIICAWNPSDLKKMALPPCHVLCQFYVNDGVVSLQMYQRSCDMGLGVPFNIASYALLLRMVCHVTGTKPGEFIHVLGDAHVYKNHIEPLKQQLEREPYPFPVLEINPDVKDINDFKYSDFKLVGYKHHQKIKMEMAV